MRVEEARKLFGDLFIGREELTAISSALPLEISTEPEIPFDATVLRNLSQDYILILGTPSFSGGKPLTLCTLRDHFGTDPEKREPCFYNQDWYLLEGFANATVLETRWYLIRKSIEDASRGVDPSAVISSLPTEKELPPAILTAYTFFSFFLLRKDRKLWDTDFVWCSDQDSNGDRIYTGRYTDPSGLNRSGFSIHRHLSIRPCYGAAPLIS